jgi:hypothetical protein
VTPIVYDAAERDRVIAAGVGWVRGGNRTIGQVVPNEHSEISRDSIGPLAVAGSYRKAALAPFGGGLPAAVGDHLADLDLALSLTLAGWTIPLDAACRVFGSSVEEPSGGGFKWGLWSERLFWRHARRLGLMRELLTRRWLRQNVRLAGPSARPIGGNLPTRPLRSLPANVRSSKTANGSGTSRYA